MSATEVGPNGKPLDLVWEALVDETRAMPELERMNLNKARSAILAAAQSEGLLPEDVPAEVRRRAAAYRNHPTFSRCTLTPMALAKNWYRVVEPLASTTRNGEQAAISALRSAQYGSVQL